MKVVNKPWGYEIWFALNAHYCFKKIVINAGCRTSLQYHEKKLETLLIVRGLGTLCIANKEGLLEELTVEPEYAITITPGRIHRITAITELVIHEVSTTEVHDTIRIQDDHNRPSGFIATEHTDKT